MSDTTDAAREIIDHIIDRTNALPIEECLMVLCYISEHCKAHAQTILAHEYHRALYRTKEDV